MKTAIKRIELNGGEIFFVPVLIENGFKKCYNKLESEADSKFIFYFPVIYLFILLICLCKETKIYMLCRYENNLGKIGKKNIKDIEGIFPNEFKNINYAKDAIDLWLIQELKIKIRLDAEEKIKNSVKEKSIEYIKYP